MTSASAETRIALLLDRVISRVRKHYGVSVERTGDLGEGFCADLDGATIYLDSGLGDADSLFAVLHLLGHCAQWNTSNRSLELGALIVTAPTEASLSELASYELEAHDFGLQLLQESGGADLEGWYSDASRADLEQLFAVYRMEAVAGAPGGTSGVRAPFPKQIPPFEPVERGQRITGGRVFAFGMRR